jgi:hypothetical protein
MIEAQNLKPGNPQWVSEKPITLTEAGVDKNLAHRAGMPEHHATSSPENV